MNFEPETLTPRSLFRHLFLNAAGLFAKPAAGIHILNGHFLARERGDREMFVRMLDELRQECRLLRIEEAVRMIMASEHPADPCVAFTFDDGFEEHYTGIAPALEQFGINAAFFVLPGFIEGDGAYRDSLYRTVFTKDSFLTEPKPPMSWEQVKELHGRGHIVGSHGMHHRPLTGLDARELDTEIFTSFDRIRENTGIGADWFAFPFGRLSGITQPVIDRARQRYRYIFSQDDHRHYRSFGGQVINRRHFEPSWPVSHVRYFLSVNKS